MSRLTDFTETKLTDSNFLIDTVDTDEIVIGGTCTHTFELPFIYLDVVKSARVTYKQNLEVVLSLEIKDSMVHIVGSRSVIYVYLPKIYTELFDASILDTFCQLEIITKDNEILYDDPHKIKVIKPLSSKGGNKAAVSDVLVNGESVVLDGKAFIAVPSKVSELENDAEYITEAYHDASKQDKLISAENIKTINGESILGNGNLVIHDIAVKVYPDTTLCEISAEAFEGLAHDHYLIFEEENFNLPGNFFDFDDVYINVSILDTIYRIRLFKNNEYSASGTLVIHNNEMIYELLFGILNVNNSFKLAIRCANIY